MSKSRYTEAYSTLLDVLLAARNKAGVTQVELAAKLQKPQSFVSKTETGERRLDVVEFCAIANALDLDPVQLLKTVIDGGTAGEPPQS